MSLRTIFNLLFWASTILAAVIVFLWIAGAPVEITRLLGVITVGVAGLELGVFIALLNQPEE